MAQKADGNAVTEFAKVFPGFNPLVELARIAIDSASTQAERLQANKELAKYLAPQLRAVEHGGTLEGMDIIVNVTPHDEG